MNLVVVSIIGLWLLLLMHLPFFNSGGSGFDLPQNILTWIVVVCLCYIAIYYNNHRKLVFSRTLLFLIISATLMTIPVFWSLSSYLVYESLPRLIGLWAGIVFYACLLQMRFTERMCRCIILFIAFSACIESVIVLQELFFPQTLGPLRSQFIVHNGRAALGTFQQVNVTASWIATGFAACVSLAYPLGLRLHLSTNCESVQKRASSLFEVFYVVIIILLTTTLVLTQSRTGWLGGFLCYFILCTFIAIACKRGHSINVFGWLAISAPIVGVLTGLMLMNVTAAQALAQHAGSNHQRILTIKITWEMIKIHPFMGWGIGSFRLEFQEYLASHFIPNPSHELMGHPHNELLYVWFEGGGVALAGFLLAILATTRLLFCQKKNLAGIMRWAILIPVLIHTQLEFPFYCSAAHFIVLLLIMAVLESQQVISLNYNKPSLDTTRHYILYSMVTCFTCIALLWLGSIFRIENLLSRFEENLLSEPNDITHIYIPPLSGLRYIHDKNTLHLINFYESHQLKELDDYLKENEQWLKLHPDPDDYDYQIEVLNFKEHKKEAEVYRQHAALLFPWDIRFR